MWHFVGVEGGHAALEAGESVARNRLELVLALRWQADCVLAVRKLVISDVLRKQDGKNISMAFTPGTRALHGMFSSSLLQYR